MSSVEKALLMLRNLPRVGLNTIRDLPEAAKNRKAKHALPRGKDAKFKLGANHKGQAERMSRPRLGFAKATPTYLRIPKEHYYEGHHLLKQYKPISLLQIQRLIDLGRLNPNEPIDLTSICNTKLIMVDASKREFGIQLTDEGIDVFKAKINIEVQWIMSETTIAAIEKNGGMVTTKFYDRECVRAMSDPYKHFESGKPVPKNDTPPMSSIEYYASAQNRGYLANPEQIRLERLQLAQKFGYELPDLSNDKDMFSMRKDPRQIWHGLEPGWVINLKDKVVLKPTGKDWIDYYKS